MKLKKYEQLSQQLSEFITDYSLKKGDRFLSIRDIMARYSVGKNTAYQALQHMEDAGTLTAEPKSGYVVRQSPRAAEQIGAYRFCEQRALTDRATFIRRWAEHSKSAKCRMDLATGAANLYPAAELQTLSNSITRSKPYILTEYAMGSGLLELRQKIALRYNGFGCQFTPDDILITHGATQALTLALQSVTQSGDWVMVESPTYFGFLQILQSLKLNVVELSINIQKGLEPDHLRSVIEQAAKQNKRIAACLLQANVQNPTGCSIAPALRAEILSLCSDHRIAVIEDDTFGDLYQTNAQQPQRAAPLKALDTHHNVILCSSLSKLIAPGLRIGFIQGGAWHEQIRTLHHATAIGCPELPQHLMARMIPRKYEQHLTALRAIYADNIAQVRTWIAQCFPDGTHTTPPRGGYLLWVTLPDSVTADQLLDLALQERSISFAPGSLFSIGEHHQHAFRLNCATLHHKFTQRDIEALGQLAQRIHQEARMRP